jgi:hypothetical protein
VGVYTNDPNGNYASGFGDTGFLPQFAYGTNEVRHFIAFLGAGEGLGRAAGNLSVYDYVNSVSPNPSSEVNAKRVALGLIAVDLGASLPFSTPKQLAQDIWRRVCGGSGDLDLP